MSRERWRETTDVTCVALAKLSNLRATSGKTEAFSLFYAVVHVLASLLAKGVRDFFRGRR